MKILVADDEPVSRRMLQGLLSNWGYEVIAVQDGNAASACLNAPDPPRLALLDWMMPGRNGVEVCRQLRQLRPEPYTYILLITAKDAKENIVEGLEAGADDYLTKPFHPQELNARLRVGLRLLKLEDGLVQARESMRFKATHDTLTCVWNRGAILETLERELSRSHRERTSLGVLMADVDHFKSVNDLYGHAAGDQVLQDVTRGIVAAVRDYDFVGRFGGEEFLILLPGCDESATAEKAQKLCLAVRSKPVITEQGILHVTMSVGGVASATWPEDTARQILQAADAALYRAKESGRNCVMMAGINDHVEEHKTSLEVSSPGPLIP